MNKKRIQAWVSRVFRKKLDSEHDLLGMNQRRAPSPRRRVDDRFDLDIRTAGVCVLSVSPTPGLFADELLLEAFQAVHDARMKEWLRRKYS
jgi:hypothetical protein